MVDLHVHSTCSDGTIAPQDLPNIARTLGLTGLALTDHDTVAGIARFMKAARVCGLRAIAGVEISATYTNPETGGAGDGELHLLGYFPQWSAATVRALRPLALIRKSRHQRNPQIVDRLRGLGLDITYADVCQESDGQVIGRPHIAATLLRKGYVKNIQQAYDRYVGDRAPAYVPKRIFSQRSAIALIARAGGIPVLAHPKTLRFRAVDTLHCFVRQLRDQGLRGIEAFYPTHSRHDTDTYRELAASLDLFVTGGSDFHGDNKPEITLGVGFGAMRVPDDCLQALLSA